MRICLLLLFIFAVMPSHAELKNLLVNGYCNSPFVPTVTVHETLGDIQPDTADLHAIRLRRDPNRVYGSLSGTLPGVIIPTPPTAIEYPSEGRVILAFYLRAFGVQSGSALSLMVSVDGYRVLAKPEIFQEWEMVFLDLAPWAGKTVEIEFRAHNAQLLSESGEVVIAQPRVVTWHGPWYYGGGGIGIYGRYGKFIGQTTWSLSSIKPARYGGHPLMVTWYDFHERASVRMESAIDATRSVYDPGIYIIPLRLGDEYLRRTITELSGRVEEGRSDVIPDFTQGDAEKLQALEKVILANLPETSEGIPNSSGDNVVPDAGSEP